MIKQMLSFSAIKRSINEPRKTFQVGMVFGFGCISRL
jgi:hypothetical protein